MKKQHTDDDRANVARLYAEGKSIKAVSRATGASETWIRNFLDKNGLKRPNDRPKKTTGKMIGDFIIRRQLGETVQSIADSYGINQSTVSYHLLNRGKHFPRQMARGENHHHYRTEKERRRIVELGKQGLTVLQIAKETDISESLVRKVLVDNGVRITSRKYSRELQTRICRLRDESMTYSAIAREVGKTAEGVKGVCKRMLSAYREQKLTEAVRQAFLLGDEAKYTAQRLGIPIDKVNACYSKLRAKGYTQR